MPRFRGNRKSQHLLLFLLLAGIFAALAYWQREVTPDLGDHAVEQAWQDQRSGIMLEAAGHVQRLLADDRAGSRHQRFILALPSGHTVLVAHNIDLAPRVPLATGDQIELRGEYEWNEQGGVIHWTHRDPDSSQPAGWINHQGERYE